MPPKAKYQKHQFEPLIGVKTDFETLLQSFSSAGTVRYEKFAECWREMKMSCYCAGRQTKREAREFVEQCLQIATQYWLPPSSFLVRSGALYLLYGLYYFQLVSPKVKIRVTPEQWKTITEFQDEAREQQHLDLDFVFQKLLLEKAFQYVATSEEVSQTRASDDARLIPESMKEETSMIDEIFSSSALNQLSLVHDQYQKMKLAVSGEDSSEPETSINIVNKDLIRGLYKTLQTHKERQTGIVKTQTSKEEDFRSLEDEGQPVYTPFEIIPLKKRLKNKAFQQATLGYRQSRGKQSDTDNEDVDIKNILDNAYTDDRPGKKIIPALYAKDEREDEPLKTTEVQELFCMPDLDSIIPKPEIVKVSASSDEESEELEHNDEAVESETDDKEESVRAFLSRIDDSDSDLEDNIDSNTEFQEKKRKQKSTSKERLKSKKSKCTKEVQVKTEKNKKSTIEIDRKHAANVKSGRKSRETTHTVMEPEEVNVKGKEQVTAQEKLQIKLTQRKKEARLKSKTVSKGKKGD